MSKEKINFEDAISKLEKIVEKLEDGELSLDDSIMEFTEGVKLVKYCNGELIKAEKKIEKVVKNNNNEFGETITFNEEE